MPEKARILVVDDEIGPRESLRMILKPHYTVATVESGEAALQTLPAFRPDLIFMDIKMPTMDGVEVLRRIKSQDPSIEIVMITAYASLETVKSALTHGAFEYLVKPFSRQDLEGTARRALARRQEELGARGHVARLVQKMRQLTAKTRELEEAARRETTEQSLRLTQLSILREISRGLLGQLDLGEIITTITEMLKVGLGYDEVSIELGGELSPPSDSPTSAACPIREGEHAVGYLLVNHRSSTRTIDTPERELLSMLSEYVAIAIRNSRLYTEIAETKRWLEQLIRSAGDGIISVDAADRIVGWNPAAEQIFEAAEAEVLGEPISRVLPEADYQPAKAAVAGEPLARLFEVRRPRKDGGQAELAVTLSALRGTHGELKGLLAIVRDVTAQREMEAQLHQSEKLRALGQLAGGIAHDFNNLLQAILGHAQLMEMDPTNLEMVRQKLKVVQGAAIGGAETVKRIQQFARLRPDEAFIRLDLNQVMRDAVAITLPRFEELSGQREIPTELRLDLGGVPLIPGRPAALTEVITNLILNALDAMPSGGTLTIITRPEGSDWAAVVISDTGMGIPEEVQRRIFDPFFTTKGEAGTGLGLSMAYSIVKRHGGDIRVESQVGRGATFTLLLPVGQVSPLVPSGPAHRRPSQPRRILLIDNEPGVLAVLREILEQEGHKVQAAQSGTEALAHFASGRFEVVLTNIGMDGMNGWQVVERVRSVDPQIPVVLITGWGLTEQDRKRGHALGVRHCLFKPVHPDELLRAIEEAVAG